MGVTHKDTLPVGFLHEGKLIQYFTVRPAKVIDSVEAIEEQGSDASPIRLRLAVQARQVEFHDLPVEAHTTELLMGLREKDYNALEAAIAIVEKKPEAPNKP